MNSFAELLQQLPDHATRSFLQAVCMSRDASLAELEATAQAGPMLPHLQRLLALSLVAFQNGWWQPTWSGRGVYHWSQQLSWADAVQDAELPEPRPVENGDQVVPGCRQYRPLYCRPGYCWCGLIRSKHASEAPQTAANFLANEREKKRREALWNCHSGRPIPELHRQLDDDQLAALSRVHHERTDGISAAELATALRSRLESGGHQVGEELLQRLAELDLVLTDQGGQYWFPTFDGAGVANWHKQLIYPAPLPKPKSGENGDRIADQPCTHYRPFFPSPGYCWCGHFRSQHPS